MTERRNTMKGNIAYCGLACDACPIHWAAIEDSPDKKTHFRKAISEVFTALYGQELPSDAINDCDGCRTQSDRIFSWCTQCPIRKCAIERQLHTCAECGDYPCTELQNVFKSDPAAHSRLEVLRAVSTAAAGPKSKSAS
jgi:hypothetical protein